MSLLTLLLACGGGPAELVCRPGQVEADGLCVDPRPEACNDGVDNDGDGLLDCEDDDCLGSVSCAETACADGTDDDGDGLIDCTDSDCWSATACTVAVQLLAASGTQLSMITTADQFGIPAGCDTSWIASSSAVLSLANATGDVRITGGGGPATTCTWSVERSAINLDHVSGPDPYFEQAWPIERTGFTLSPDCPLRPTDPILPASFFLDIGNSGRSLFAGRNRTAPLWAQLPNQPGTATSSWTSSSASYGATCDIRYLHEFTERTGLPAVPGSSPFHPEAPTAE